MRNKKGALDVSINSIVVIIFAIVMLGLGIVFIREMITKTTEKIFVPEPEQEATGSEPLVLRDMVVHKGDTVEFTIFFFNGQSIDIPVTTKPTISACTPTQPADLLQNLISGGATEYISTLGQTVEVGSKASYKALIKIKGGAPTGKNICNLNLGTANKQFYIEVKQ